MVFVDNGLDRIDNYMNFYVNRARYMTGFLLNCRTDWSGLTLTFCICNLLGVGMQMGLGNYKEKKTSKETLIKTTQFVPQFNLHKWLWTYDKIFMVQTCELVQFGAFEEEDAVSWAAH